MTGRAASSTAVLVCQGRATADGRYAVGRFSDPIARELLDPAERLIVDEVRADRVPTDAAGRMAYEMVRRTGLTDNDLEVTSDSSLLTLAEGLGLPSVASRSLRNGHVAVAVRRWSRGQLA